MKLYGNLARSVKEKSKETAAQSPEVQKLTQGLTQKETELKKYQKELEALKKEKQELLDFKNQMVKEKETGKIKSELVKTAKKLNIKESALDDVVDLTINKFTLKEDKVLAPGQSAEEFIEPEVFMTKWLEGKDHYIQPTAAAPAKLPPVQNVEKQRPVDNRMSEMPQPGKSIKLFNDHELFNRK